MQLQQNVQLYELNLLWLIRFAEKLSAKLFLQKCCALCISSFDKCGDDLESRLLFDMMGRKCRFYRVAYELG